LSRVNFGKQFEQDLKASVPKGTYVYRLRDCAGWSGGDATRFTPSNDFDFLLYREPTLLTLELKNTNSTSLRYDSLRSVQEKGLLEAERHKGVVAGVLVFFRKHGRCYFVPIFNWLTAKQASSKVSFNVEEAEAMGIPVAAWQPKTRWRYDITGFIDAVQS
jgi:recombination protein U